MHDGSATKIGEKEDCQKQGTLLRTILPCLPERSPNACSSPGTELCLVSVGCHRVAGLSLSRTMDGTSG